MQVRQICRERDERDAQFHLSRGELFYFIFYSSTTSQISLLSYLFIKREHCSKSEKKITSLCRLLNGKNVGSMPMHPLGRMRSIGESLRRCVRFTRHIEFCASCRSILSWNLSRQRAAHKNRYGRIEAYSRNRAREREREREESTRGERRRTRGEGEGEKVSTKIQLK